MAQLSQLGFWMFSGALGAVGVAATMGYLDQPPRGVLPTKTAIVSEPVSGGNAANNPEDAKVAKLATDEEAATIKNPIVTPSEIIPTFDVLRVEIDGSTLIAGKAEPNSTIEIFDGVAIVAKTTAGKSGDFVAILENPLLPGEHQLGIRATGKDSKVQVSEETGLVSMPKKQDGQLLAMVMKPGEASRILQKPETDKPVIADSVAKAKTGPETTLVKKVDAPSGKVAEKKPEATKSTEIAAIENKGEAAEKTETVVERKTAEPNASEQKTASLAPGKSGTTESANPVQSVDGKSITPEKEGEKPAEKVGEKAPTIIVEAVEVDGARMFIAGAAEPGRRVAIYVNNKLIGFADGSREGRFLLEVERDLARGKHVVRADIYDAAGKTVAARAEVPLIHEPEQPPVVIAKVEPKAEPQKTPDENQVETAAAVGEKQTERTENVTEVQKQPTSSDVGGAMQSGNDNTASSSTSDENSPVKKSEPKKMEVAAVEEAAVETAAKTAEKAVEKKPVITTGSKKKSPPKMAKNIETAAVMPKKAKPVIPEKIATIATEQIPTPTNSAAMKPAEEKTDEAASLAKKPAVKIKKAEPEAENKPVETVQAPTKAPIIAEATQPEKSKVASLVSKAAEATRVLRTGSSVIIRRGDSLWRISYRTYGRGIRYSTIYQANLNQLRSPHRIYPGQILKVPKKKFSGEG